MQQHEETSWTLIEAAARGDSTARASFSRRYLPLIRAYLGARWSGTTLAAELDDAVQEVFVDCFRVGGVLERADPERASGFRAFLYGVVTRAAQRIEVRRARERVRREDGGGFEPDRIPGREESLSRVFDREWAMSVMREAAELQSLRAREKGPEALRRVDLLHLRFHEGMPIRDIARLWNTDAARLHHDYAQARKEFTEALREVVGLLEPNPAGSLEEECSRLMDLLG
jgi:RNA polymerase sigma factor (sigma-70 family)